MSDDPTPNTDRPQEPQQSPPKPRSLRDDEIESSPVSRRSFLGRAGFAVVGSIGLLGTEGCIMVTDEGTDSDYGDPVDDDPVDPADGDVGDP